MEILLISVLEKNILKNIDNTNEMGPMYLN